MLPCKTRSPTPWLLFAALLMYGATDAVSQAVAPVGGGFRTSVHFSSTAIWNADRQEAESLSGLRAHVGPGTPITVATEFLKRFGTSLGLDPTRYSFAAIRDSQAGGRRVYFQEFDGAVPIPGTGIVIGVNHPPRSSAHSVASSVERKAPFTEYTTSETIDYTENRSDWYVYFMTRILPDPPTRRYADAIGTKHGKDQSAPDLSPFHLTGGGRASGIDGPEQRTRSNLRLSRSSTGTHSSASGACPSATNFILGSASVYKSNPNQDGPRVVTLNNLCEKTPVVLDGRYVSVIPENDLRTSSPDGAFLASPSQSAFDETMAYYHVDNFVTLMKNSGMYNIISDDYKITAVVKSHVKVSALAQYTIDRLLFGKIEGAFLTALYESAIVAHETTHLLMNEFYSTSYLGSGVKEHWAMGEAYADYIGIAYRARQLGTTEAWRFPVIGSYYALGISHNLPRDLTDPEPHFSGWGTTNYVGNGEGISESNLYDNAIIFSTALMDYDRTDHSDQSLSFVIESLSDMNGAPSFLRGFNALVQAVNECALVAAPDQVVCCDSGTCSAPVFRAFEGRGIFSEEFSVDVEHNPADTPDQFPRGTNIELEGNYPSPFAGTTTIVFRVSEPVDLRIRVLDLQGREVTVLRQAQFSPGEHEIEWSAGDLPSGMYFYEIASPTSVKRRAIFYVH